MRILKLLSLSFTIMSSSVYSTGDNISDDVNTYKYNKLTFQEENKSKLQQERKSKYVMLWDHFYSKETIPLPLILNIVGRYSGRCYKGSAPNKAWAAGLEIGVGEAHFHKNYPGRNTYWAFRFNLHGGIFKMRIPNPANYFDVQNSDLQLQLMNLVGRDFHEGNILVPNNYSQVIEFVRGESERFRYDPSDGTVLSEYFYQDSDGSFLRKEFCEFFQI